MTRGPRLIWLASYPKSGNTWFRLILAHLAADPETVPTINEAMTFSAFAASRKTFEAAAMLDSDLLAQDAIEQLRPRMFDAFELASPDALWIKVHDAYTYLRDGRPMLGTAPVAAVYLVRDPRDVAVSLAHFIDIPIDESIAFLASPTSALGGRARGGETQLDQRLLDWSGHVESWSSQDSVPAMTIRYEDLRADPEAEVARALRFAQQDFAQEDLARAIEATRFETLQHQESELGFVERPLRGGPFFRAGRSGGWREVLSDAQRRRIEDAHGAMMDRFGYARE